MAFRRAGALALLASDGRIGFQFKRMVVAAPPLARGRARARLDCVVRCGGGGARDEWVQLDMAAVAAAVHGNSSTAANFRHSGRQNGG